MNQQICKRMVAGVGHFKIRSVENHYQNLSKAIGLAHDKFWMFDVSKAFHLIYKQMKVVFVAPNKSTCLPLQRCIFHQPGPKARRPLLVGGPNTWKGRESGCRLDRHSRFPSIIVYLVLYLNTSGLLF